MKRVYFIKPVGMQGPVKVGCSISPDGRRASLETWSPFSLEIIAEIEGDHDLERRFHGRFIPSHRSREWFDWSPDIQAVIEAVNAGTFDTGDLPAPVEVCKRMKGQKRPRTPDQRLQQSYSLRAASLVRRSGHTSPVNYYDILAPGREDDRAAMDRYLADPINHGVLIDAPWARARSAAYREKIAA